MLQIALVGYTNAGKSTWFNRLTSADSYEEDLLFATLDPMTRKWSCQAATVFFFQIQ
ncbi:GTPase [Klebsiella pneumoniae]